MAPAPSLTQVLAPSGDIRLRVTGGTRRSFLFVYNLIVSIDHVILWTLRLGASARGCAGTVPRSATVGLPWSTSAGTGRLVERGSGSRVGLVELVQRAADGFDISAPEGLPAAFQGRIQPGLGIRW